eukprot:gnl/TRDRNA2_/TRDRNA2_189398_c0_seq1.p1 gnl/TRDRNA2_/TRDRNA2_189398_c0~~gnl/TRDRNA2_/TRDRNA2_189398_c0_seq1.p1  ORF type:complete len:541 (-),score=50.75 gnl/TRDRNA2_/TRDRNA2_189398_c0_seq1:241-1734(-)
MEHSGRPQPPPARSSSVRNLGNGLCAKPVEQCNSEFLGSRKQHSARPNSSERVAALLSPRCSKAADALPAAWSPRRSIAWPETSDGRWSPQRRHFPDRSSHKASPSSPWGPGEEMHTQRHKVRDAEGNLKFALDQVDFDTWRTKRVFPQSRHYYTTGSLLPGKPGCDFANEHDDEAGLLYTRDGPAFGPKLMGLKRRDLSPRCRSGSPSRDGSPAPEAASNEAFMSSQTWPPPDGEPEVDEAMLYPAGPKGAVFRRVQRVPQRRKILPPGEAPPMSPRDDCAADPLQAGRARGRSASPAKAVDGALQAAGLSSPRYDRNHGMLPRSPEDEDFRSEVGRGYRRHFAPQLSGRICKGLSPEATQYCMESFLGERRRKSPSPGSSPWNSPCPTPPRSRGASPAASPMMSPRQTIENVNVKGLLSWSAVATSVGDDDDLGASTGCLSPTPEYMMRSRNAAIERSTAALQTPWAGIEQQKYRRREMNASRVARSPVRPRWRF